MNLGWNTLLLRLGSFIVLLSCSTSFLIYGSRCTVRNVHHHQHHHAHHQDGLLAEQSDDDAASSSTEMINHDLRSENGCTFDRIVQCDKPPQRKAVVFYMLTNNDDQYTAAVEWDSFAMFLHSAYMDEDTSTQLFERVDFVFSRITSEVDRVTLCAENGNTKLLWVPPGPCDLCAHSLIMDYIGEVAMARYSTTVFMNSGVRGPFLSSRSSSWIDVVAAAGLSSLRNDRSSSSVDKPEIVSAAQISWMHTMHPQSYFLVAPRRATERVLLPLFKSTCPKTKFLCAIQGEVAIGWTLIAKGFGVHSLGKNFSILRPEDNDAAQRSNGVPDPMNPCVWPQEPCNTVFLKFGGDVFRNKGYPRSMLRMIYRLEALMPSRSNPAVEQFLTLLQRCDFLQGDSSF